MTQAEFDALFQSTLPVWGATDCICKASFQRQISIHAPRVGSDEPSRRTATLHRYFNPRSPCGERRQARLLAPPVDYFNPRSPCGERPYAATWLSSKGWISIHAPRVGSDFPGEMTVIGARPDFNPRSPCGERQRKFSINLQQNGIKSKNKLNRCNKKRHEQHEKSANLSDIHWALKGRTECGEIRVDGANIP